MQWEVCRLRRAWPVDPAYDILVFRARQTSERILEHTALHEQTLLKVK